MPFNDPRRQTPDITQRMSKNQLRDLETDGLVDAQVPPKVEYYLEKNLTQHRIEKIHFSSHPLTASRLMAVLPQA